MTRKRFIGVAVLMMVVLSACSGAANSTGESGAATLAPTGTVVADGGAGGAPMSTAEPGSGAAALEDVLPADYEDALSSRNQLALGTLRLEGTENAVTADQAQMLAFLWQALQALSEDSTSAPEEMSAVQTQIVAALTEEQIDAIRAMALTNADLTDFYAEQGVEMPTPEPGVTPQGGGGQNSGVSQEDREATRAAAEALGTPVGTGRGSGGGSERQSILLDTLISLLLERAES
ncbi:MAG: hypothetical protein JXA14_21805 [Anaerolineae bacterium]|nr:hypothetical protein [Anaerolineae bacterium]